MARRNGSHFVKEAFPDLNREQQGGGGSDESRADSVNLGAIVEEGETEDSEQHADDSFDELTGSDNNYPQNTEELDSSDDVEDEVGEDDQRTLDRVNELAPRTIGDKMLVKCAEDDDFQKDFDKLLAESITQRSDVARQTNVNEIVIPLTSNSSGGRPLRQVAFDFNGAAQQAEEPVMPTTMNLMVMQRGKSNKAQLKSVQVPLDSELGKSHTLNRIIIGSVIANAFRALPLSVSSFAFSHEPAATGGSCAPRKGTS